MYRHSSSYVCAHPCTRGRIIMYVNQFFFLQNIFSLRIFPSAEEFNDRPLCRAALAEFSDAAVAAAASVMRAEETKVRYNNRPGTPTLCKDVRCEG